jgi:hypothetical protein
MLDVRKDGVRWNSGSRIADVNNRFEHLVRKVMRIPSLLGAATALLGLATNYLPHVWYRRQFQFACATGARW